MWPPSAYFLLLQLLVIRAVKDPWSFRKIKDQDQLSDLDHQPLKDHFKFIDPDQRSDHSKRSLNICWPKNVVKGRMVLRLIQTFILSSAYEIILPWIDSLKYLVKKDYGNSAQKLWKIKTNCQKIIQIKTDLNCRFIMFFSSNPEAADISRSQQAPRGGRRRLHGGVQNRWEVQVVQPQVQTEADQRLPQQVGFPVRVGSLFWFESDLLTHLQLQCDPWHRVTDYILLTLIWEFHHVVMPILPQAKAELGRHRNYQIKVNNTGMYFFTWRVTLK